MKLLFITIDLPDLTNSTGSFYGDMIKALANQGNHITVIAPKRSEGQGVLTAEGGIRVLRVSSRINRKDRIISKGMFSVFLPRYYWDAYKKALKNEQFDWILLPTPPPTLVDFVKKVKRLSGAKLYLILRDIQPECANRKEVSEDVLNRDDVYIECKKPYSINIFAQKLLYSKSQNLYKISDMIGCMSPGNVDFMKRIAPYLNSSIIKVLPNWYSKIDINTASPQTKELIKKKYNLEGKTIAIYGGVLGAPQGVWNFALLAKHFENNQNIAFLIVGRGEGMKALRKIAEREKITNLQFIDYMPREEYEAVLALADIGLISLDEKYKVPTCPSKIIGYMAMAKPVLAMFNKGSDYGKFYIDNPGCGLYSVGLDTEKMYKNMQWMIDHPQECKRMGEAGYNYFLQNFTVEKVCDVLCKQLENE